MTNFILDIFKVSTIEIFYITGMIILVGFLLGILENIINSNMQRAFGYKGILITAWLGTPIHELGHAAMCVIFGHKISRMKLLQLNSGDGTLGFVEHSYNKNNIYQRIGNFFIGIGPIFSGISALLIGLYLLLPNSINVFENSFKNNITYNKVDLNLIKWSILNSASLIKFIFTINNLSKIGFWVFILLAFAISSHIALSKPDIKGAQDGLITLYILLIFSNTLAKYFSINTLDYIIKITKYNAYFSSLLFMALIFSIISFFISCIAYYIRKLL
ncbi:membrane protein [Clostridium akagii]|uniref:membrane protein n=1 Tax=Clostridium akagii TaxID=91623 RepID=UPI00047CFC68|nr:membrane protein [Clostridium akagii]